MTKFLAYQPSERNKNSMLSKTPEPVGSVDPIERQMMGCPHPKPPVTP
jgi:hypothetical protein